MSAANDAEYVYDEAERLARDIAWSNRAIYLPPPEHVDAHWWRVPTPFAFACLIGVAAVVSVLGLMLANG